MCACTNTENEINPTDITTEPISDKYEPFVVPAHFPSVDFPTNNPPTIEKHELGRHLFFDFRLSINGTRACGICHEPPKGWTDGFVRSVGATNEMISRNSLSIINVAYRENLNWRDLNVHQLESQMLTPLLGTDPIEMGMPEDTTLLIQRLEATDFYPQLFEDAFPGQTMNYDNVAKAIGIFERTIISGNSPYDAYLQGHQNELSVEAQRGRTLFFGPKLKCSRCHGGLFLDSPTDENGEIIDRHGYFNTGLYNIDGQGGYPPEEIGLAAVTGSEEDMGVFRVPSLRNVMLTAPYSHDGTVANLDHLLTAYARGGRLVESGPYPGDGALNPYKSSLITGFNLSDAERSDVLAFLNSLTDHSLLTKSHLKNPFCETDTEGMIINAPCKPRYEID